MKSDKNSLGHITLAPKERIYIPSYVYVGHPIKKLFEKNDHRLIRDVTIFIEEIACVLKQHNYVPLIPSLIGHNVERPTEFDTKQIYMSCAKASRISSIFIALPFDDSTGLGMEYQIAHNNHIPIISLCDKRKVTTGMINANQSTILSYDSLIHGVKLLDVHLENNSYHENFSYFTFQENV